MIYKYDLDANEVTATNKERNANGDVTGTRSTESAPWNDPGDVPGNVP